MNPIVIDPQLYVAQFAEKHDLDDIEDGDTQPYNSQFNVMEEEFEEVREALAGFVAMELQPEKLDEHYNPAKEAALAEELADLRFTVDLMASMVGVDIVGAEVAKARYNLEKSAEKNEDGKVIDDSDIEKPDFSKYVQRGDNDDGN